MKKINVLTPSVYNLISAGEVIERPASVVKELVENSIDAGATEINISIENGGISFICISDNGIGILPDDLKSAFLPHATSKLEIADDLQTISTLGFRGEALASISAISEVSLVSKTADSELASTLTVKGGNFGEISKVAGKKGTTITVKNLFYNTPVRLKFLKKPKSEERIIVAKIQELILANPEISFNFSVDNKLQFSTDGNSIVSALYSIYDRSTMRELIEFSTKRGAFLINGFFSKPTYSKANRTYQTIIINGRVVNCNTISTAIERAYSPYLMKRCYPMFIVNLILPFDMVDVNVHPAKSEVRFSDNNAIFGFVFSAMREMLENEINNIKTINTNYFENTKNSKTYNSVENLNNEHINSNNIFKNANADQNCVLVSFEDKLNSKSFDKSFDNKLSNESYDNKMTTVSTVNHNIENETDKNLNQNFVDESNNSNQYFNDEFDKNFANSFNKKMNDISSLYSISQKRIPAGFRENNFSLTNSNSTQNFDHSQNVQNVKINQETQNTNLYKVVQNTKIYKETQSENNIQENANQNANQNANLENTNYLGWKQSYKIIGQLFDTYIILQNGSNAFMIDQHAAHERILFDNLIENLDNKYSQSMLFPYEFKVNGEEFEYFKTIIPVLQRLGFEVEILSDCSFAFNAIPLILVDIELDKFVKYLFEDLSQEKDIKIDKILIDNLAQKACKSAIKGGNTLNNEQIEYILDVFFGENGNLPTQCPHGRPAVIKLSKTEIEKMFKRKL